MPHGRLPGSHSGQWPIYPFVQGRTIEGIRESESIEVVCLLDLFSPMYYIVYMILYESRIKKLINKGELPRKIVERFHNAFLSLELTKDLGLFDIKRMKGDYKRHYFRLRKGKYRAIFYIEKNDIFVVYIGKREEVYDLWE